MGEKEKEHKYLASCRLVEKVPLLLMASSVSHPLLNSWFAPALGNSSVLLWTSFEDGQYTAATSANNNLKGFKSYL